MKFLLPFFCFATFAFYPGKKDSGKLTIRFEGIEKPGGTVRLALYGNAADFMVEKKATLYNFKVEKKGTMEVTLENLPTGSYAFAVFLDENNNMKLDKNLVGVPIEPYGFSKEPPSKWRLPTWHEVKFELGDSFQTTTLSLKRWAFF